jgi:signal transduction histidine kinase
LAEGRTPNAQNTDKQKDYSEIMTSPPVVFTGDITERTRVEAALAEQAAELSQQAEELRRSRQALETQTLMLQSVLDGTGEGLVASDREGHFLIWNDTATKLMGGYPFVAS